MNPAIQYSIGVVALIVAFFLWKDHADRIAKTRYWPIGWALYMLLIITAGKCLVPFLDGLPLNDDVAVPCFAAAVMLVTGVVLCVQLWRMRRSRGN